MAEVIEPIKNRFNKRVTKISGTQFLVVDRNYSSGIQHPKHVDVTPRLSIVLSGQLKETVGQQEVFAKTASLVVKPGCTEHSNEFGPKGARVVSVELKLGEALSGELDEEFKTWRWFHGLPYASQVFSFIRTVKEKQDPQGMEASLIELLASLPRAERSINATPPDWLIRLKVQLREEFQNTIYVQDLARENGVHPVYLARVFRKFYGCSVKHYIRQLRLNHLLSELTSSQKTLVDLAFSNGFSDQSHFNRIFKSELGMSPGQFRQFVKEF